jgi:hypothetical protein
VTARTGVGVGRVSGVKELLDDGVDHIRHRLQTTDGAKNCRTAIAGQDGEDMTPLHFAYKHGVTEMVEYLLEKSANRDAKAKYNITPVMLHPLSAYS